MLLTILATVGWHLATQLFWYKHPVEQKLLEMVRLILMMIVIMMTMLRINYDDDYYDHDHFISPIVLVLSRTIVMIAPSLEFEIF